MNTTQLHPARPRSMASRETWALSCVIRLLPLLGALTSGGPALAQVAASPWIFAHEQTLFPPGAAGGHVYGKAVSLDSGFLAIGNPDSFPGRVAVYQATSGSWTADSVVLPNSGPLGESFGSSLDLQNGTLVVGAPSDGTMGTAAGATYVFVRGAMGWAMQAELFASDAAAGDSFGCSVAIDADTLVVGARFDDDMGQNSGSAYVFTRTAGVWSQSAKIVAGDGQASDGFGFSLALQGDTAVVGAPFVSDHGLETGAVYALHRTGQTWTQQAKLYAPWSKPKDRLGWSIAFDAGTLIAGAPAAFNRQARAYCFLDIANNWTFQSKLSPIAPTQYAPGGQSGISVDIDGNRAIIGVPGAGMYTSTGNILTNVGGAYVFERQGNAWQQIGTVTREPLLIGTWFGWSTSIKGAEFLAGIPGEPLPSAGAASVFKIVPGPEHYCTAKTNALGCVPAIDFRGVPSSNAVSGFQLLCTSTRNNEPGLVLYGTAGRASTPFQGGLLCIIPPVGRTTAQNSYGSAAPVQDCSGVYALDWSGFAAGLLGGTPQAVLRVPGTVVQTQWWGRDPGFAPPANSSLSDAIEFTVCP